MTTAFRKWLGFEPYRLRNETRELLITRPLTLTMSKISEETGISKSWLATFSRGDIENPGVVTIQILNAYLKRNART